MTGQSELTTHQRHVLEEVRDWYVREPTIADRWLGGASGRARRIVDTALATDLGRRAVAAATDLVVERLSGDAREGVLDLPALPAGDPDVALRAADERARELRRRYVGLLASQGAVLGAGSTTIALAAVATSADIGLSVYGSLHAALRTLAAYGVRPTDRSSLHAAIEIAAIAAETDVHQRRRSILNVAARLSDREVRRPVPELGRLVAQQIGSRTLRETVEQTVRRAAHRRLLSLVPVLGAAASGAASGWLASQVCESGQQIGRLTFIVRRTDRSPRHLIEDVPPGRMVG